MAGKGGFSVAALLKGGYEVSSLRVRGQRSAFLVASDKELKAAGVEAAVAEAGTEAGAEVAMAAYQGAKF